MPRIWAAGIFNKETDAIRQLMTKSSDLLPINSILLTCPPSQTLFFSDRDKKIATAIEEADRHRPNPPKSTFFRSSGHKSRGGGKLTSTSSHEKRQTPYQKPMPDQSPEPKKLVNDKGHPF
jgi:hypothetical protein